MNRKDAVDKGEAMSHELRVAVLAILRRGPASAGEIASLLELPAGSIRHQLRRLLADGLIEPSSEAKRRGVVERFFVATDDALVLSRDEFAELPPDLRRRVDLQLIRLSFEEARRALAGGTLSARDDSALTHVPLRLDERGWAELAALHLETFNRVQQIGKECRRRLDKSKEAGLHATSILMLFEVPGRSEPGG